LIRTTESHLPEPRESPHESLFSAVGISGAFLKKSAQKTFARWVRGFGAASAHDPAIRSLFASFSSEKEALASP
jgi:hypothetical protein